MTSNIPRLQHQLKLFPSKPDNALIDIEVLSALLSRSRASIYRDIEAGQIPLPTKVGRSSRWSAGIIRDLLANGIGEAV